MRCKVLSLIFLLAPAAALSKHGTLPVQLIDARTVSIVCYGRAVPETDFVRCRESSQEVGSI
jgi:hypothetical protein